MPGTLPELLKQKRASMLCSTNTINPKLQNFSMDTVLTLQNTLDMQQFQYFQEAPALSSSFTYMLEKRPRFLNAQPHVQGKSTSCSTHGLAPSLVEQIWKSQQPVFTCHLFHGLATSLPIPLGIPRTCYVCRWLSTAQMEVTQFPSDGLQEKWQGEGHQNSSQLLPPVNTEETEHRLPKSPGSNGKLPRAAFPHREQTRTHTYMHLCNKKTKCLTDCQIYSTHKCTTLLHCAEIRQPDHHIKGRSSVVVHSLPQGIFVPSQKALVLFTGKLLYCMVLQAVHISKKHLENIF